ncbi:unnamed protein product [Cercopithifilaria johnstoni]|uniref:Uncharacterized protein n=1 Tax=Cercopithifilaria johnstoni TaxID=2874296 RepID=A0A8J2QB61_9BILA|nr:unnamed protein product [Cercopithifilaria johnstoni]
MKDVAKSQSKLNIEMKKMKAHQHTHILELNQFSNGVADDVMRPEVMLDDVIPDPDVVALGDVICASRRTMLVEKPGKFGKRIPISRALTDT